VFFQVEFGSGMCCRISLGCLERLTNGPRFSRSIVDSMQPGEIRWFEPYPLKDSEYLSMIQCLKRRSSSPHRSSVSFDGESDEVRP
jgi:hypothetical protein